MRDRYGHPNTPQLQAATLTPKPPTPIRSYRSVQQQRTKCSFTQLGNQPRVKKGSSATILVLRCTVD